MDSSLSSSAPFKRLPSDVLQHILSFLSAADTLRSVALVSPSLASITQGETYWRCQWAAYVSACFARYVHPVSLLLVQATCAELPENSLLPVRELPEVEVEKDELGDLVKLLTHVDPISPEVWGRSQGADTSSNNGSGVLDSVALAWSLANDADPLLLRRALCFLNASRPILDGIRAVRVVVFLHTLPPPHRRDATLEERGSALVDLCRTLSHAWRWCNYTVESHAWSDAQLAERLPSVFFDPRHIPASAEDVYQYTFLLHHVSFSDVHQHIWEDERKFAICSRVVSPTGRAVELRFFTSSLLGSYPRFFVKTVFTTGDLPRTCIAERFDTGGDAEPMLHTLFFGGYGRVEVDIQPAISRAGFARMREALGMRVGFPMELLWNVALLATGAGAAALAEAQPSLAAYYSTSFTKTFGETFPAQQ